MNLENVNGATNAAGPTSADDLTTTPLTTRTNQDPSPVREDEEIGPQSEGRAYYEALKCEVCLCSDQGTEMLICEDCGKGLHIDCILPPLIAYSG